MHDRGEPRAVGDRGRGRCRPTPPSAAASAHARRARCARRAAPHGLGHVRAGGLLPRRRTATLSACVPSRRAADRWRSSRPTRRRNPSSSTTTSPSPRTCARRWARLRAVLEIAAPTASAVRAHTVHGRRRTATRTSRATSGTAQTIYHPTSTCRMRTDELAMVDQRHACAAWGLRVVDASIFPSARARNTTRRRSRSRRRPQKTSSAGVRRRRSPTPTRRGLTAGYCCIIIFIRPRPASGSVSPAPARRERRQPQHDQEDRDRLLGHELRRQQALGGGERGYEGHPTDAITPSARAPPSAPSSRRCN